MGIKPLIKSQWVLISVIAVKWRWWSGTISVQRSYCLRHANEETFDFSMWVTFTQTKQSGVLSAANIYGHVSVGRDCLDEFLRSLSSLILALKGWSAEVVLIKVEPVYPWALSLGHDELLLDCSFHSLLNIVLLTFPMVHFCCEPLLKLKCPLFCY